jgi:hypothetical protein
MGLINNSIPKPENYHLTDGHIFTGNNHNGLVYQGKSKELAQAIEIELIK